MKKLSNNVIQDLAFNAWAKNKEFASEEAFTAALSAFRHQQATIDQLNTELANLKEQYEIACELLQAVMDQSDDDSQAHTI